MNDQKLDLILETLKNVQDRLARAEADAAAALDSTNLIAKTLKSKNQSIDHQGVSGIGFDAAMKLVAEAEDRTTTRLTHFLQLAMTSQKSAHDSFLQGLTLGRELAESDLDDDGDPDGSQYITPLVDLAKEIMASKKPNGAAGAAFVKGMERGLQSRVIPDQGREAVGDPLPDRK